MSSVKLSDWIIQSFQYHSGVVFDVCVTTFFHEVFLIMSFPDALSTLDSEKFFSLPRPIAFSPPGFVCLFFLMDESQKYVKCNLIQRSQIIQGSPQLIIMSVWPWQCFNFLSFSVLVFYKIVLVTSIWKSSDLI